MYMYCRSIAFLLERGADIDAGDNFSTLAEATRHAASFLEGIYDQIIDSFIFFIYSILKRFKNNEIYHFQSIYNCFTYKHK